MELPGSVQRTIERLCANGRTVVLAVWCVVSGSALADIGLGSSVLFTVDTRYGFSEGAATSGLFTVTTLCSGSAGDGASGLFTVDTLGLGSGQQAGSVSLYPTVSYAPASGALTMTARAIDRLYGNVTSGSFGWTLEMAGLGRISAGTGSYNPATGLWQAGTTYGSGLTPGEFTVRYTITSDRGRQGSASLPLTVGAPSVVVNGTVNDAASKAPLAGAYVALFPAGGADGLWTLVNAQYGGVMPPLATLLTRLIPIRSIAATGSDGRFSWADVPVGESYVVVAAKSGYQQRHSGSFDVPAGIGTISQALRLPPDGPPTLAALTNDVLAIRLSMESWLDANATTAGALSEQYYEDDIYGADYEAQDWFNLAGDLMEAASGGAKVVEAGVKPVTKAALRKMRAEVLKEATKAVADYVVRKEVEWIHDGVFPSNRAAFLQSEIHTYYLDALRQTNAAFESMAASFPLTEGFSISRFVELSRALSDSVQSVVVDQNRYLVSPEPNGPIYGFTLNGMSETYAAASQNYHTLEGVTVVLSSVQIVGGAIILGGTAVASTGVGAPVGGAAAGIAATATAAAGYGKTAIAVAEEPLKLYMLAVFTHAICGSYPRDNLQAVQVYGDLVSLLRQESASPFYLRGGNRFGSTVEIALQDSWPDGVLWAVGGLPGLDVAEGTATVTIRDQSSVQGGGSSVSVRCLGYTVWTPITVASLIGAKEATVRTSSDVRGPVTISVGGQAQFLLSYRGHSRNFLSQFKPHYLVVEGSTGPWKTASTYSPFWVLAPGEIFRPFSASAASSITGTDIMAAAASAVSRLSLRDLARRTKDAEELAQSSLSAATPSLTAQFTAGTNLWAIDLRLFAPADAGVSVLVTDSQGRRLGYSSTNGLTYSELTGLVTRMGERPISLRLLQPPAGETYTVTVALLTPGPQPVQVALFKEDEPVSGGLLVAQPSRVVVDSATESESRVEIQILEGSQQQPLTNVTATLTNLVKWDSPATLAILTNTTQTLGDIGAGEGKGVAWPLAVSAGTERGKYVSVVRLTSGQTADLVVPVVALIRRATNVVSLLEGTNASSGTFQTTLLTDTNGVADTWVYVPKGFVVLHAALGLAPGSTNVQSPAIDVGADGSADWSLSGLFDVGLRVDGLEGAFNRYLASHMAGSDDTQVPIRIQVNAGQRVQLGGLQLYLEAATPELRLAQVLPDAKVEFDLLGQPGCLYRIEASPDLAGWSSVGSVVSTNRVMRFTDTSGIRAEQRFYRAVLE